MEKMPLRLQVKGPGEFVRDLLQEVGTDYVQSMYKAYKLYLRQNGIRAPSRLYFGRLIYILADQGGIRFDHADTAAGWRGMEPDVPARGYRPGCGSPAPRHYYRLVNAQAAVFARPDAEFRRSRGLEVPEPLPRVPPEERPPAPPKAPRARKPRAPKAKPVRAAAPSVTEAYEKAIQVILGQLDQLESAPTTEALNALGRQLLGLVDKVQVDARRAKGEDKAALGGVSARLLRAAEYSGLALGALQTAMRETLPMRRQAAERSLSSALGLLRESLAPAPVPEE